MRYQIGIDVGGTFTDFALYNGESRELSIGKVLTTPEDPSEAVLVGVDELVSSSGLAVSDLTEAIHATTIATNTVIERKGAEAGLLTTKGFRDVLLIGRQKRWELYDNAIDKPQPVIPRRHIWEVQERLNYQGEVLTPLDRDSIVQAAEEMKAAGVKAVGICFLHSYANNSHEKQAAELIREIAPEILVSISSDVSPIYREYERASTTSLNAYVMPIVSAYVKRLSQGLSDRGFTRKLFIMQSNGGVATPEVVQQFPIRIIESGPAAGVLTAAQYSEVAGNSNLISFDMGGTTAKVCLVEEGRPALTGQFEVDMVQLKKNSGLPISIPAIDLVEIGSGGGSIARIEMGAIAVGPESAGSVPGPIAYGRGGVQPTVTDADLLLGYLDPNYFLGGQMNLDIDAAKNGIQEHIAKPLEIDVVEAAWGIYEVVTSQMAQAARVVSVGKGKDPRNFALIPFGGAGPVHGARLAKLLGCSRIVFPARAGVMSAIGLLTADVAFDLARTHITPLNLESLNLINSVFEEMQADGHSQLAASGISGNFTFVRSADMRFVGQGYEIGVDLPDDSYGNDDLKPLLDAFFKTYAETYGDRAFDRSDPVEIVHYRVTATAIDDQTRFDPPNGAFERDAQKGEHSRPVFFPELGGFSDVAVHRRNTLVDGQELYGPLVIEEPESTVIVPPGSAGHIDKFGNIVIDLELEK